MFKFPQRIYKAFGLQIVHPFEVVLIYTFCRSGTVDNVIELTVQFPYDRKVAHEVRWDAQSRVQENVSSCLANTPGCWTNECLPIHRIPASTLLPR